MPAKYSNLPIMLRAERDHMLEIMSGPGYVRPTISGLRLPIDWHIGECEYLTDDSDEVIRSASERLTFVHRVDHTPEVDNWGLEELDFTVRHIEKLSGFQQAILGKMRLWAEYESQKEYKDLEPLPRLEEMWS